MVIYDKSMQTLRREIARQMGDLMAVGTAISPTATTIDSGNLVHQDSNLLKGKHLYLDGGAGVQQSRAIYAFTPFSPGSANLQGQLAILNPFATTPSTNTEFLVTRRIPGEHYTQAIQRGVRRAAPLMLQEIRHYEVLGSHLENGLFNHWTGGTSSAPDEWTKDANSTISRETEHVYPGAKYATSLVSDGTNAATLSQSVSDYGRFAGLTATLKAIVHTETASRVRLRLADGTTTQNGDTHAGEGDEELSVELDLADAITELTASLQITSGGAVTAIMKKIWLEVGDARYAYPLPLNMLWLNEVRKDGAQEGVYDEVIPDRYFYVAQPGVATDATLNLQRNAEVPRLVFIKGLFGIPTGSVIEVIGQKTPAEPSAETDSLEVDPEYVTLRAMEDLYGFLPWGEQDFKSWQAKWTAMIRKAEEMERWMRARPRPGSIRVRQP